MRQKNQVELNLGTGAKGEAPSAAAQEAEARAARTDIDSRAALVGPSMEAIVERENLKKALAQVKRNKGAASIDGMGVDDLAAHLKEHWPTIREQLLEGTYKPQPVRRVEIPKASGGMRPLGIPTVLDRFIQQAVMQVLQADWDRTFSEASFGFRPGRSAHQAVARAQELIASGHNVVVDIDLEKFFDRVNHDILMGLVAKRVTDKRILRLIRGFLTAGVLADGLVGPTEEGTPQGGPMAPRTQKITLSAGVSDVGGCRWPVARSRWQRDAVSDDDLVIADENFLDEKTHDALAFHNVEETRGGSQSSEESRERFSEAHIGCAID